MYDQFLFNAPSEDFSGINAALPIGNGYMGMQVEDNIVYERLALNESTLWSGGPYENNLPGAYRFLPELRASAFRGEQRDFDWESRFVGMWGGQILLPAGDFMAYFANSRETTHYRKKIDLRQGVLSSSYQKKGEKVTKEYFANYPSNVICFRYANSKSKLNFACEIVSKSSGSLSVKENLLLFEGQANGARGVEGRIRYAIAARVCSDGKMQVIGKRLIVKDASYAEVFLSIATNFRSVDDLSADYLADAVKRVDLAYKRGYQVLRAEHIADFSAHYEKVSLRLGTAVDDGDTSVKELQRRFYAENDPAWVVLYFNYTRYLILSSTRNGSQPPTLQGIWNDKLSPPWDCKYTVNINLEMNYWSVAALGWPELYRSLLEKMLAVAEKGRVTAKEMYNITRGNAWVLHHNTDLWNVCGPIDGCWGLTPVCGAWLINELFTAYEYTQDETWLSELYSLFHGCAEFFCDFLVPYKDWLVTCPSTSPERMNGPLGYVTFGSAHDNQIVLEMFEKYLLCEKYVGSDPKLAEEVREKMKKLPPPAAVGPSGLVKEFYFHDYDFEEDTHRHLAHLYGLYPGQSVYRQHDPALNAAIQKTLDCRSRAGDWTGWGIAWRIALYARIGDAVRVGTMIKTFLDRRNGLMLENGFGALPYENGSAFQYDCNGAFPAVLAEAFVQSEAGRVNLLPAVPDFMHAGEWTGLYLRGGLRMERLSFAEGRVLDCAISSVKGGKVEVVANGQSSLLALEPGQVCQVWQNGKKLI